MIDRSKSGVPRGEQVVDAESDLVPDTEGEESVEARVEGVIQKLKKIAMAALEATSKPQIKKLQGEYDILADEITRQLGADFLENPPIEHTELSIRLNQELSGLAMILISLGDDLPEEQTAQAEVKPDEGVSGPDEADTKPRAAAVKKKREQVSGLVSQLNEFSLTDPQRKIYDKHSQGTKSADVNALNQLLFEVSDGMRGKPKKKEGKGGDVMEAPNHESRRGFVPLTDIQTGERAMSIAGFRVRTAREQAQIKAAREKAKKQEEKHRKWEVLTDSVTKAKKGYIDDVLIEQFDEIYNDLKKEYEFLLNRGHTQAIKESAERSLNNLKATATEFDRQVERIPPEVGKIILDETILRKKLYDDVKNAIASGPIEASVKVEFESRLERARAQLGTLLTRLAKIFGWRKNETSPQLAAEVATLSQTERSLKNAEIAKPVEPAPEGAAAEFSDEDLAMAAQEIAKACFQELVPDQKKYTHEELEIIRKAAEVYGKVNALQFLQEADKEPSK